jgi:hypothetical protein
MKETLFVSIIAAMVIASVVATITNIQTVSAQTRGTQRDLPLQAGRQDIQTNTNCGGGEEVRSAFPSLGTQTGPETGLLNSGQPSPEAHQQLNQGWAATAGSCGSGTPGGR